MADIKKYCLTSFSRIVSSSFWIKITVPFGIAWSLLHDSSGIKSFWYSISTSALHKLVPHLFCFQFPWSQIFNTLSVLATVKIMSASAFWLFKLNCFAVERVSAKKHNQSRTFTSITLLNFSWSAVWPLVFSPQELCAAAVLRITHTYLPNVAGAVDLTGFIPPSYFKLIFNWYRFLGSLCFFDKFL